MGELMIRAADERDVSDLAVLRAAWTRERHGTTDDAGFEEAFGAWVAAEDRRVFFLATLDDEVVGMVNLLQIDRMPAPGRLPGSWGYLNNMYVRPEHRNDGVGGALLSRLLDHATAHGFRHVLLHPSERATAFYLRHGFAADTDRLVWGPSTHDDGG